MISTLRRERPSGLFDYLCLLCACSLYLYVKLFTFSGVPYLFEGDQIFFWTDALRLLHGQHAYTDFFQFTTPGTDFFYLVLFRVFGARIWVTDLAILVLGCGLCCACFSLASQLMRRRDAFLATAIFLALIYGRVLDATHHWFSLLAVIGAVRVLVSGRSRTRLIASGCLLGVASFFTQTTGVAALVGICAALLLERRRQERRWKDLLATQGVIVAAFSVTFALLSLYFVWHVGWRQLWYLWVVYASRNVSYTQNFVSLSSAEGNARSFSPLAIQRIAVLLTSVGVYIRALWLYGRGEAQGKRSIDSNGTMLACAGIMLLAAALVKPNWNRIYIASMPAMILLVWLCTTSHGTIKSLRTLSWAAMALLGIWQVVSAHKLNKVIDLPAGRTVLVDQRYAGEFLWLSHNTRPGDMVVQAAILNSYLPFELRDPLYVDGLWPNGKTPERYVDLSIRQVEEYQVKYVLWAPQMIGPVDATPRKHDPLLKFRAYLSHHYHRIEESPNGDEVWQRAAN